MTLSYSLTNLTADLDSLEVVTELVTVEVEKAISDSWTDTRLHLHELDLLVIVEHTEVSPPTVHVHSESHVACSFGILRLQRHRALDHVGLDLDGRHVCMI